MNKLVKELIVFFGFLNGFLFSIGIDPQQEIINLVKPFLENIHPYMKTFFIVLPLILLLSTLWTITKIYRNGGFFGIVSVLLAFIAGTIILMELYVGLGILLLAIIIGYFSFNKRIDIKKR